MNTEISRPVRQVQAKIEDFFSVLQEAGIPALNLSRLFAEQRIEQVAYRTQEYRFAIATLNCAKKSNLVVTGESGVGKTAFIHYLSAYIPDFFSEFSLAEINVASLLAGTAYRGEFEKKISTVIEQAVRFKVIIFFDEAHTLSMTGGPHSGGIDALNILKPHLTGEVKCILSTTTKESEILKSDAAFARRFRFLDLAPLNYHCKANIIKNKFNHQAIVSRYLADLGSNEKPLHDMIDEIDFLISMEKIKEFTHEINT